MMNQRQLVTGEWDSVFVSGWQVDLQSLRSLREEELI